MRRLVPLAAAMLLLGIVPFGPSTEAHAAKKIARKSAPRPAKSPKKSVAPPAGSVRRHPAESKLRALERTRVPETPAASASAPASAPPPSRGPTRIDFDDRLIQGQTNRSGAVYLYDRKELKTRSMLKSRDSFRDEIVRAVYDS